MLWMFIPILIQSHLGLALDDWIRQDVRPSMIQKLDRSFGRNNAASGLKIMFDSRRTLY